MIKYITIIFSAIVLGGCATTQWNHSTNNQSDFYRDSTACREDAQRLNPLVQTPFDPRMTELQRANANIYAGSHNLGAAYAQNRQIENCMSAKGYYKAQ